MLTQLLITGWLAFNAGFLAACFWFAMRGKSDMDLFDYVPARRTDPHTSRDAALAMQARVSRIRQDVLLYALDQPQGFTDWQMCQHFGNHSATYRTRRSELTQAGEIVPTLERRATPSGRAAVVWVHKSYRKEMA